MLHRDDWAALLLTFELAGVTTLCLLVIGLPLAWFLARGRGLRKVAVEVLVATPLVLPPTVLGFYLLLAFSPLQPPGSWLHDAFGVSLAFSFEGLVIASCIYSLPFVVQPLQNAFEHLGRDLPEAAATLGHSPLSAFFRVVLPNARAGLVTATCLGFAHTVGEFGLVLMIGGNIPGETRVASVALYDHAESLDLARAHGLALTLLVLSVLFLAVVYGLRQRQRRASP